MIYSEPTEAYPQFIHIEHLPIAPRPKRRRWIELLAVLVFLILAFALRYIAALHTGIEVDEPIYRYAGAYTAISGYPSLRPSFLGTNVPFLYHPPFFFFLLGTWFKLWGSSSFLAGRMFSAVTSIGLLALVYAFVRKHIGKREALATLFLLAFDAWVIFTNQGIYLENSQMLFIVLAVWVSWYASHADETNTQQYVTRYLLAGLLIGWAMIYKQIGVFLFLMVLIHLLLTRKHWKGNIFLLLVAGGVMLEYGIVMHGAFGTLFDGATWTQLLRTLWSRQSPGLNYSPLVALRVIVGLYWIFFTTILTLVGGSILVILRLVQHVLGKRKESHPLLLAWAGGGIAFAVSISLKSPHYMILWLIPLYIYIVKEALPLFTLKRKRLCIVLTVILLVNLFSFQARFLHGPEDTLLQVDAYINTHIPSTAVVATEDYIGVDIQPAWVNINFIQTPTQLFASGASYAVLYSSSTEPLPVGLSHISQYCIPMQTFHGFKDTVEVCQIK